jgi:hypothetical protein
VAGCVALKKSSRNSDRRGARAQPGSFLPWLWLRLLHFPLPASFLSLRRQVCLRLDCLRKLPRAALGWLVIECTNGRALLMAGSTYIQA